MNTASHGTRTITNMGAANPRAAAVRVRAIADELGLGQLRVAVVTADDVLHLIGDHMLTETGRPARDLGPALV